MACCGGVSLARKLNLLTDNTPLGAYLGDDELANLAKLCMVTSFRTGQILPESPFYCIVSGEVQVVEETEVLCTKYAGAFFTRRAGLVRGRKPVAGRQSQMGNKVEEVSKPKVQRTSIVKDFEDLEDEAELANAPLTKITGLVAGRVLYIPAESLDKFLFTCRPESAVVVKQIARTNIGTQLSQVPFIEQCPDLEPRDLRALGEICSYRTFDPQETVFSQGDKAENFYIILKGKVEITIDAKALRGTGETVSAGTRNVGDSFGVAALVYNAAERKYSAKAVEKCLCLVISRENFAKFISQKPSLEDTLMRGTKNFLLQRYSAMNVPIFAELSKELLDAAASKAKFKHFDEGEIIYHQGDAPTAFYVVLHGEVKMTSVATDKGLDEKSELSQSKERNLDGSFVKETKSLASHLQSDGSSRVLTVGMHFGEVGMLLPQTPCIATCECIKKCTLLTLESTAFLELFGQDTNLLAEMQIKVLRQHATLRSALNHKRCRPLFEAHIKKEFSEESILFFDAVSSALATVALPGALAGESRQSLMLLARKLVDEYIVDGSQQQVNIPGGMQKAIIAAEKTGDAETLFSEFRNAQGEIYLLMARDNWPRFVKTDEFQSLLDEIGSYGEDVKELVSESDLTMLVQDGEGDAMRLNA